jgi:hypothetical protein
MNLQDKIRRLKRQQDLVLYKWVSGQRRIAENFILLSDLRLNVLTCDGGRVVFSSAAPVMFMERNHPVIQFRDADVLTIMTGPRRGINVNSGFLKQGEDAAVARFCEHREIFEEDRVPKWLEDKIMSMGHSPVYPVSKIVMPELFRISRKPDTLKPVFNSAFIKEIGGEKGDSLQTLLDKFHSNLDKFGYYTEDGFVISNDLIASGGCCVCASRGITTRSGSVVHMLTKQQFVAEISRKHWHITTTEKEDDEIRTESSDGTNDLEGSACGLAGGLESGVPGDSDQRT